MEQVLLSLFGVVVGGLITLLTTRIYYEKASKELNVETEKLRQLNELMLRAMEQAGLAEFTRDKTGKIIGLHLIFKVSNIQGSTTIDNIVLSPSNPGEKGKT